MKKRTVLGICFCIALVAIFFYFYSQQATSGNDLRTISVAGNAIHVTVADTDAERELGLGGRNGLAADEGMLFVFPRDGIYTFWMKEMQFSIDIIWIANDGRIVYIAPNISPDTYPQTFVSTAPARYVLEVQAGYSAAHNVGVGDTVEL